MRLSALKGRPAAALPLLAAFLLLAGCQQMPELPSWMGGTKPASQAQAATLPPVKASEPSPAAKTVATQAPQPQPTLTPVPAVPAPPAQAMPPATAATSTQTEKALAPKTEIRAALLLPLSGPQASMGQVLSNAAQLALFEIADSKFSLLPLDTKGTPEGAQAATTQALTQGADIILGPVFGFEAKAAGPMAREQGIPMLAFTTDRSAAGSGVYALGFLPGAQAVRVLTHAKEQGRTRIGVLVRSDEYGRAVAESAKDAIASLGLELVALEYYDPAATDFTQVVKRFTAKRPPPGAKGPYDAILLPDEGTRLKSIASLLTYFLTENGMEPPRLLGTLLWDDPKLAGEPALSGGWFPAPSLAAHAAFEQRYVKAFGPLPPRSGGLAGIAYDATALAAALARNGMGDFALTTLQNPNGFAGVDGLFRLTPLGLAERGMMVKEITLTGIREVSPAPDSFKP